MKSLTLCGIVRLLIDFIYLKNAVFMQIMLDSGFKNTVVKALS